MRNSSSQSNFDSPSPWYVFKLGSIQVHVTYAGGYLNYSDLKSRWVVTVLPGQKRRAFDDLYDALMCATIHLRQYLQALTAED